MNSIEISTLIVIIYLIINGLLTLLWLIDISTGKIKSVESPSDIILSSFLVFMVGLAFIIPEIIEKIYKSYEKDEVRQ